MERMIRKQTYIFPHQERALKSLARQRHETEAEIIREALERYLNDVSRSTEEDPMLGFIGLAAGGPRDGSTQHDRDIYDA